MSHYMPSRLNNLLIFLLHTNKGNNLVTACLRWLYGDDYFVKIRTAQATKPYRYMIWPFEGISSRDFGPGL